MLGGKRVNREQRSIAISAARSLIFNTILDARVRNRTWNQVLDGELVNLDGSGSVFGAETVTAVLRQRCLDQDIHPTASLWGEGAPQPTGQVALLELEVAADFEEFTAGLTKARVDAGHRSLRLRADELRYEIDGEALRLSFRLPKGAYATALLRELVQTGLE